MIPECHGPIWAVDDVSVCFQRKYETLTVLVFSICENSD